MTTGVAGHGSATRRVLQSAVALVARSAWERALSLVATLALARLLVPRDLGVAALVLTTVAVATTVVDAGLTIALVREPEVPTEETFAVARRIQLVLAAVAFILAVGVAAWRPGFGALLVLDALQLLIDPFVLQPKVMLQRALRFSGLATADAVGVLCRAASSLVFALAWQGPTALVVGDVVAAFVTSGLIIGRLAAHADRPPSGVRPEPLHLLRRSVGFQGFALVVTGRDLSGSALIGALTGVRALGLFQFAFRAMSPVFVIFSSLGQLAVPVGARVVSGARRPLRQVREGYLVAGLLTAVILAVASSPAHWAVPLVFGPRWTGAVPLISAMALALVISGPACTFGVGLILAADRARLATIAAAACVVLFLLTLTGFSSFGGIRACAAAYVVSAVVETAVIVTVCRRELHVDLVTMTLLPVPIYVGAFLAGSHAGSMVSGAWASTGVAAGVALAVSGVAASVVSLVVARTFTQTSLRRLVQRTQPKVA